MKHKDVELKTETRISAEPSKLKNIILEKTKNGNTLSGVHMNIRNQGKNIDQFRTLLDIINLEYDFIGLTECWSDAAEAEKNDINIKGYHNVHSTGKYNQNGGVHLYINQKLKWKIVGNDDIQGVDSVEVEIENKEKAQSYVIILVYRSPARPVGELIGSINDKLKKNYYKARNTIVMGDLNVDLTKATSEMEDLLSTFKQRGYNQHISEPTRQTANSNTLIDHCYSNIINKKIIADVVTTGVTDHLAIHITVKAKLTKEEHEKIYQRENTNKEKAKL